MFDFNIKMNEIKNMDQFIEGVEAASLENEFKNYKVVYKDGDFRLGYNMGKRQYAM